MEIRHSGNQKIPEFYDNNGNKKSITFEISEYSTIAEAKDEMAKQVRDVDRTVTLFNAPFGKKLTNTTNIKEALAEQNKNRFPRNNSDQLILFIVIPYY